MLLTRLTLLLGILTTLSSLASFIISATNLYPLEQYTGFSKAGFLLMCFLQCAVALFMAYASKLKLRGADIAEKFYPSSLAAQVLLVLMWQYV